MEHGKGRGTWMGQAGRKFRPHPPPLPPDPEKAAPRGARKGEKGSRRSEGACGRERSPPRGGEGGGGRAESPRLDRRAYRKIGLARTETLPREINPCLIRVQSVAKVPRIHFTPAL